MRDKTRKTAIGIIKKPGNPHFLMARPIRYVVELSASEAQRFLDDILNPTPNPARDAALERARNFKVQVVR